MPGQRLPMRKIRDVLRLRAGGMSKRKIAASLAIGATAAGDCVRRARRAGLSWSLPENLSDEALERLLYPPPLVAAKDRRAQPDWAAIRRELRRSKVVALSANGAASEAWHIFCVSMFGRASAEASEAATSGKHFICPAVLFVDLLAWRPRTGFVDFELVGERGRQIIAVHTVSYQDVAAAVPDPKTVSGESSATAEQVAPIHVPGALAEPGGGRPARS
jgi:hypothetical protein